VEIFGESYVEVTSLDKWEEYFGSPSYFEDLKAKVDISLGPLFHSWRL
jgi:hypothetical protein